MLRKSIWQPPHKTFCLSSKTSSFKEVATKGKVNNIGYMGTSKLKDLESI